MKLGIGKRESGMGIDLPLWKRGNEGDLLLMLRKIKSKSPMAPFSKGGKSSVSVLPLPSSLFPLHGFVGATP